MHKNLTVTREPIYSRPTFRCAVTPDVNMDELTERMIEFAAHANNGLVAPSTGVECLRPLLWVRYTEDCVEQLTRVGILVEAVTEGRRPILVTELLMGKATIDGQPVVDTSDMPTLTDILATLIDREKEPVAFALAQSLLEVKATKDINPTIKAAYERFAAALKGAPHGV